MVDITLPALLDCNREGPCRSVPSVRRAPPRDVRSRGWRTVRRRQSDFDFLVTFKDDRVKGVARLYLGLAEGLEQLLERPVDLLTPESIRNPYFRQTIDATRRLVYED